MVFCEGEGRGERERERERFLFWARDGGTALDLVSPCAAAWSKDEGEGAPCVRVVQVFTTHASRMKKDKKQEEGIRSTRT